MSFAAPVPFAEAIQAHDVKSLLPTTGRTVDLQKLDTAIKQRALWSATVQAAEALQVIDSGITGILAGNTDQATVRLAIKEVWQKLGYQPDPEQADGLLDLGSDARINLQIETNVATARGAGWFEQGQNPDVLDEFPAQELYDTAPGGKSRRDWLERWAECGGKFYDGRMIALKDDPVWDQLGDPDKFPDGLGNEFPPFAFNSKWRVRDIDRDEAVALGLIDQDTQIEPQSLDLNGQLQATPDVQDAALRAAMEQSGLGTFDGDVFKFKGGSK